MVRSLRFFRPSQFTLMVAVLLLPTLILAAERFSKASKAALPAAQQETVEMFAAIDSGQIGVRLIPKDSTQSQIMIENKTRKPLTVKLPDAFAGVPVLAQNANRNNRNNNNNNNMNQGMGGGMGGMMGGMGMFNVAPEKVGKFAVATVCLEHGKNEPRAAIPYEIKPIESFTDKPEVQELCRMLGSGQLDQRAAQVAAWHLNNGMSWEELAAKRLEFANGSSRPYFSPQEIQGGMRLSAMAARLAEQRRQSPGESESASLR